MLLDISADDNLDRTVVCLSNEFSRHEIIQSWHGFDLSVGSVIGMIVALLKHIHLQNDTGLYASYSKSAYCISRTCTTDGRRRRTSSTETTVLYGSCGGIASNQFLK
jgi:hypothetical protein